MPVLTVRISEKEKAILAQRAEESGVSVEALVRCLINEQPLTTAAALLAEMNRHLGDTKLRIPRKKEPRQTQCRARRSRR